MSLRHLKRIFPRYCKHEKATHELQQLFNCKEITNKKILTRFKVYNYIRYGRVYASATFHEVNIPVRSLALLIMSNHSFLYLKTIDNSWKVAGELMKTIINKWVTNPSSSQYCWAATGLNLQSLINEIITRLMNKNYTTGKKELY